MEGNSKKKLAQEWNACMTAATFVTLLSAPNQNGDEIPFKIGIVNAIMANNAIDAWLDSDLPEDLAQIAKDFDGEKDAIELHDELIKGSELQRLAGGTRLASLGFWIMVMLVPENAEMNEDDLVHAAAGAVVGALAIRDVLGIEKAEEYLQDITREMGNLGGPVKLLDGIAKAWEERKGKVNG